MRALIGAFEGCRLSPYQDSVGVWTIGYGHTGKDVHAGSSKITQAEADHLLAQDLARFERAVERLMPQTTQQQFDALVSFAFNLGEGALEGSTLRKLHNAAEHHAAAGEFQRWNHAGGKVLAGLTRRRLAEASVYANGDYGGGHDQPPAG
jgi:lysozyme